MNGLNGGNVPAMVTGYPTPAGYQAELAYIYNMVEVLSQQLAENKRALEDVVASVGRVRSRARTQALGNEELLTSANDELTSQDANMDTTISLLTELFERAKFSRDEYRNLSAQYASVIAAMLKQFHDYKQKHMADVGAWHRSYRAQLAEERAENTRLREQIWEMQAHAGKANENLRQFRTRYDEDKARWEKRVDTKAMRQELRFWKRLAMPELAEDDPYWSDDDDLVDNMEKLRLQELERKAAEEALAGVGGMDQGMEIHGHDTQGMQIQMGGVPMQREDSSGMGIPVLPPRPSSAASTGSSGQCIQYNRYFGACGHTQAKIVRCALPFYWFDDRIPEESGNEPFFECFKCLDEVNETYSNTVACTDCTGFANQIYSSYDLVATQPHVQGVTKDEAAYDRVVSNYHTYLATFIGAAAFNERLMTTVNPTDNEWRRLFSKFMLASTDKYLAEQKCRQDPSHNLPDSVGVWLQSETHVSEHRPWLNNVSTAIKRSMVNLVTRRLEDPRSLNIKFFSVQADNVAAFNAQPFREEVREWWNRRGRLDGGPLKVPTDPANNNRPFEFVEYVPLLSNANLDSRIGQLSSDLEYVSNMIEIWFSKDEPGYLQGREPEVADRHEKFFAETMEFIHALLAFDPGLSESRMAEIAQHFASLVLEPWLRIPDFSIRTGADRAQIVPTPEARSYNNSLRAILAETSDRIAEDREDTPGTFWARHSYNSGDNALMFNSSSNFRTGAPTTKDAQSAAVMRWMDFYRTYQQALTDATASETRTEILKDDVPGHVQQGTLSDSCVVCGTDWADMNLDHNLPVYFQPCGLRHAICKGCFQQVSLQPATLNGRKCPLCKLDIVYPLRTLRLRADLGTELEMPALAPVHM